MLKTDWYKKAWTKPHFWPLQWTDVRPKCMPVCVCARVQWRILEEKSGGGLDSNNGGLLADGVCTALAKWSVFRHYYPTMCVSTVNADSYDKKWGSTIWQAPLSKKWGGTRAPRAIRSLRVCQVSVAFIGSKQCRVSVRRRSVRPTEAQRYAEHRPRALHVSRHRAVWLSRSAAQPWRRAPPLRCDALSLHLHEP